MATPADLWHIRKQMTLNFASFIFMTFIFSVGNRNPSRISFSRTTGSVFTTDLLTCRLDSSLSCDLRLNPLFAAFNLSRPEFGHTESVPFRFTPNLQKFFGAIGTEGVLSSAILAIARALTEVPVRQLLFAYATNVSLSGRAE